VDLQNLVFSVDSTQLDEARIKIAKLGDAVGALNKPLQDMARSSAKTNEIVAKSELAAEKARAATKALGEQVEDSGEQMSRTEAYINKLVTGLKIFRGETITVQDSALKLGDSFTKGQANALAYQMQIGATTDQLKLIAKQFQDINAFSNTNPFDKSTRGLSTLRQEIAELQMVDKFMRDGVALTREQIINLAKDSERLTQAYNSMGKSQEELTAELARLKTETIDAAKQKNILTEAARQSEIQAKKEADALIEQSRAIKLVNDAMMKEWAASKDTKDPVLVDMADFYRKQGAEADVLAAKIAKLDNVEQKLAFTNQELAAGMTTASANALYSYKKGLEDVGTSSDVVAKKMQSFREQLMIKQQHSPLAGIAKDAKHASEQVDHLSRAIGVQLGDVAVSLAGGMNPFMVLIQQGDQLRFAVQAARDAGQDLEGAMKKALSGIINSFVDTGKVIGGFFLNSFNQAGKAVVDFGTKILFLNKTMQAYGLALASYADGGNKLASGLLSVLARLPAVIGVGIASFAAFAVAAGVAFFQVEKQLKALTTNLVLTGGSLGLTTDSARNMAQSMEQIGVSSSKALDVITAMAKQGGFASKEIELVTKSAVDMQKWLGVSVEDTVKQFAKLKGEPVDALIEIAKQTGLVDSATLATVISLQEQGRSAEAAAVAMKAYGDATVAQVQRAKVEYTEFAKLMIDIGSGLGKFWDGIKSMWIKASPINQLAQQINDLNAAINTPGIGSAYKKQLEDQRNILSQQWLLLEKKSLNEEQTLLLNTESAKVMEAAAKTTTQYLTGINKLNADRTAATNEQAKLEDQRRKGLISEQAYTAGIAANKIKIAKIDEDIAKENKKNNAEGLAARKKAQAEFEKDMNVYQDLMNKADGANKAYNDSLAALNRRFAAGSISQKQYNEAVGYLIRSQPGYIKMMQDLTKAFEDYDAAITKVNSTIKDWNNEASIEATQLSFRRQLLGKTTEEQFRLNTEAAKQAKLSKLQIELDKELAEAKLKLTAGDYAIKEQALIAANAKKRQNVEEETNLAILEDYQKKFEAIQKELGDVMFLALTNRGAQAGKKLRDLIKAELMKPITVFVNAVIGNIMQGFTSAGGSGGDLVSSGINSAFGSSIGSAIGGFTVEGSTLSAIGSSIAAGFQATLTGQSVSAASAAYSAAGQTGVAAGLQVGAYAPYALAAVIALDQLGYLDAWSGDPDAFLVQQARGTTQNYSTATQSRLGTVGFVNGNATIMKNGQLISEYGETEGISTKAQRAALDVINSLDNTIASTLNESQIKQIAESMSGWYQKSWSVEAGTIENFIAKRYETILGSLDSSFGKLKDYQKEGEKLTDTAVRLISTFTSVRGAFETIGVSTEDLTYKLANDFASVFGGVDKFGSAFSSFYENFYSESEKTANLTRNLTEAFSALGYELPSTKDAFKELVLAAVDAGNPQLTASLLGLQDAFVTLTDTAGALVNTVESIEESYRRLTEVNMTAEDIANQRIELEQRLFEATATQEQLLAKARSEIHAYNLTLYDQVIAAEQARESFDTLLESLKGYGDSYTDIQKKIQDLELKQKTDALELQKSGLEEQLQAVQALIEASRNLKKFVDELVLGTFTVEQTLEQLKQKFTDQLGLARSGDVQSFSDIQGTTTQYLDAFKTQARTAVDVKRETMLMALQLEELASTTEDQNISLEQTLKQGISDLTKSLDELRSVNVETLETLQLQLQNIKEQFVQDLDNTVKQVIAVDGVKTALEALPPELASILSAALASTLAPMFSSLSASITAGTNLSVSQGVISSAVGSASTGTNTIAGSQKDIIKSALTSILPDTSVSYNDKAQIYTNLLDQGYSSSELIGIMQDAYGASVTADMQALDTAAKINDIYNDVLGRKADTEGLSYWLNEVQSGNLSTNQVLDKIVASANIAEPGSVNTAALASYVPKFASGGYYQGGLAITGESGPELINFNQPGQVYTASQTSNILGNSNSELVEELQALRQEVTMLRAETRAVVSNTSKSSKLLDRVIPDGQSVQVTVLA